MGKRRGKVRDHHEDEVPRENVDIDEDDLDEQELLEQKQSDCLTECLDRLSLRRSEIRESGVDELTIMLQRSFCDAPLQKSKAGVMEALFKSVFKRGTETEGVKAMKCLSVVIFSFGTDAEGIDKPVRDKVQTICLDKSLSPELRAAAIELLATMTFVACDDEEDVLAVVQSVASIITPDETTPDDEVLKAALLALSALFTVCSAATFAIAGQGETTVCDILIDLQHLLEHKNLHVRAASGEAFGTFFWKAREHYEDDFSFDSYGDLVYMEDVLDRLYDLSKENSRHKGKKERHEQRKAFKELSSVVEFGQCEPEDLIIDGNRLVFADWLSIVQLRFCRDVLGAGLAAHMARNPLLADIFDLSVTKHAGGTSSMSRKAASNYNAAVFKEWTRNRKKDRKIRQNQKDLAFAE